MRANSTSKPHRLAIGLFAIILSLAASVRANSIVIGGSGILTQAGADQLATWLGQGDLTLTDIFSHTSGDGKTSLDFHAAVDGMGSTFSVLEVTNVNGSSTDLIVGGYNPRSWNSSGATYSATSLSDYTAFLFNLSADTINPERTDENPSYQAGNDPSYGPLFGGGSDLLVDGTLDSGYANAYSYAGQLIGGDRSTLTYSHLDVFTISPVPEPTTWAMLAAGAAALLAFRPRRGSAQ